MVLEKTLKSPVPVNPEYSLERLLLRLKRQYFGQLMGRADSLEKTQMLGKTEEAEKGAAEDEDGWTASPTQWA